MRICASIRLAHFVASTLFALCVSLSLSDVHPCRAWRVHGIAVQKRNIRGTLRKERLPSNICVYKHILQMQTRPIYDRASCTYSMCGDWRRAIPSFHRTIALWYWAYFTRFPLFCFVRCIFFHFFISEWITISTANINDTNWAWADERLEIHINSPDSVVRCGMAGSALHAVFLCTHRNLLVFGVSHTFTCSSVGTPFWIDRIKVGCACCRPFAMRIK